LQLRGSQGAAYNAGIFGIEARRIIRKLHYSLVKTICYRNTVVLATFYM